MMINEEKIDMKWLNSRKKNCFCKKTAHSVCCLQIISYICNVAEGLRQTMKEAYSFHLYRKVW